MAVQPQGRYFSSDQLAGIREQIESSRTAKVAAAERRRRNLMRSLTEQELTRDGTFGELASDAGVQLAQGATDLAKAAYGIGNFATFNSLERLTGLGENFRQTDEILEGAKTNQLQFQKAMAGDAFENEGLVSGAAAYLTSPRLLGDLLVRSVPSILPGAAFGATAARAAGGRAVERGATAAVAGRESAQAAGRAAAGATGVQVGGQSFTDAYNQALEEGLGNEEALAKAYQTAAIVAPVTAASMTLPGIGPAGVEGQVLARLFGGEGVGRGADLGINAGRRVLDAVGREAAQETIQGTSEQAALNLASTERNITDNLGQTAVLSSIAGGAMGAGLGVFRVPSDTRRELDALRTEAAGALGDPSLGLSEIEKSDAQKQNSRLPSYLSQGLRPREASTGLDLSPNQISLDATRLPDEELPLPDVVSDEDMTGQQVLEAEELFQSRERPGLPEVSEPTMSDLLPQVREIETNTDSELEEAIQITEMFRPTIRQMLENGTATEQGVIRGVQFLRDRGVLPQRAESGTTQGLFQAVTTPPTGITEQDLIPAPLESPQSKAFKAYQRRVAARGAVAVPEGQDLLGDPLATPLPVADDTAADPDAEPQFVATDFRSQLDVLNTAPNALRPASRESVSQIIDRTLGISQRRKASGSDLLTQEDISAQQEEAAEAAYIADRFTETDRVDSAGNPIYTQYDRDLQTQVEIPYSQVQQEAQEFVRQRTAKPSELWKDTLAQDLDLPRNTALRGKGWNAFTEAVDEAGVRPTDDNVATELTAIAKGLSERVARNDLPTSKFMEPFLKKYGPGTDIAQSVSPTRKKAAKAKTEAPAKLTKQDLVKAWKSYLAETLGVTKPQVRGKAWSTFQKLANERGIRPGDEGTEAFLQEAANTINAPDESAPLWVAALQTAYPVAEDVEVTIPTQEPAPEAKASEATQELEATVPESKRRMFGEEFETQKEAIDYFVTTFEEAASEARSAFSSETTAKKEAAKIFRGMLNQVTDPADLPALAKAMMAKLQNRKFTGNQRRDMFWKPLAQRAKQFMAEAETTEQLEAAYRPIESEILDPNATFRGSVEDVSLNEIRRQLTDYKGDRVDMLIDDPANANNTSKFSRAGTGTKAEGDPLSKDVVTRAVKRANRLAQPGEKQITVYDTVAEAEQKLGIPLPADTNGIYYNGEAAVVRENITTTEQLADTMLHERTHGGLEGLLGAERLRAVNSRLWSNPTMRKRIKAKMEARGDTRQDAAEEVLVDMIVGREEMNKSIFSKLRAAINRTAEALVGQAGYTVSDADINQLLIDTADYMRGTRTYGQSEFGRKYNDELSRIESFLRMQSVPTSPKLSTAGIDLEAATRTGEIGVNSMKKASTALAEAVRSGMKDGTLQPIADALPSSIRQVPEAMMGFAPLRALANHYRGLLTALKIDGAGNETRVDTLSTHANNTRAKDNDFNKTLNDRREYTYRGPDGDEKMTFSNQEIAEQWAQINHTEGGRILNKLNNRATTYKIHPDRAWDKQSKIDYTKVPYTEAERKQQHETIRKEWQQMGDKARTIYKQSQASYNRSWTERFNELSNTILRESGLERTKVDPETGETVRNKEWLNKWKSIIDTSMRKLSEGPYSPLQRHGNFFITVRDSDGGVIHFSAYDNEIEAMNAKRRLDETKTDPNIKVQFSMRKQFDRAMDGMNRKVYENLEKAMDATFPADSQGVSPQSQIAAKEALKSVYLSALDDSHILKHGVKRKLVDGASLDTLRGFTSYTLKSARSLASMRYDHKIEDNLRDMEKAIDPDGSPQKIRSQNAVYNAVRKQHRASIEYQQNKISEVTTQLAFVTWMSSPAQMALNASQTALVTLPRLAAKYGVNSTRKALGRATAGFVASKGKGMHDPESSKLDKDGAHYQVMRELFERGVLDFTLAHDMSGLAQGENFGMGGRTRKGLQILSWAMHKSEVLNRELAAFASVELQLESNPKLAADLKSDNAEVRKKALDELTDVSEEVVDTTQFDYSQPNKPANLQGPVFRVVFQFQQFRINMLAMMATDIKRAFQNATTDEQIAEKKEARRALGYMLTTQLMMTGAAGSVLAPVAFMIFDRLGDEDDLLSAREQFMQTVPQVVSQGILSLGLDSARFGWDTLLPFSGASRYMPVQERTSDQMNWLLLESIGPVVGMGQRYSDGWDSLWAGDYLKSFELFAPDLLADSIGGGYRWLQGEQTMTRDEIPYYEPSGFERLLNMAGLKSGDQAEAQHDRNAIYSGRIRARNRKSKLLTSYHLAETAAEKREAMDDIVQWNRTNPDIPIKNSTIKSSGSSRMNKIRNAQQIGAPISDSDLTLPRRLVEGG